MVLESGVDTYRASGLRFSSMFNPLIPKLLRRWQPRLIRALGWRLLSYGAGVWSGYLSSIWPEVLFNVQSFDPEIIEALATSIDPCLGLAAPLIWCWSLE